MTFIFWSVWLRCEVRCLRPLYPDSQILSGCEVYLSNGSIFFLSKFVSHSGESSFGSLFPNMTNFIDFPDMNHTCLLPFKTVSPSLCNIAKLNQSLEGMLLPSSLQTIWLQIWGISIEWEGPTELRTSSGAGVQRALNTELPVFISLWGLRQHYLLLAMLRDSMLRKLPWSFGSQRLYGAQHHTALKSHL